MSDTTITFPPGALRTGDRIELTTTYTLADDTPRDAYAVIAGRLVPWLAADELCPGEGCGQPIVDGRAVRVRTRVWQDTYDNLVVGAVYEHHWWHPICWRLAATPRRAASDTPPGTVAVSDTHTGEGEA